MSGSDFPITEAIKRQQEQQAAVRERRRTRHNSLSPINQDRFERRFSEIDKNNDGLIDQREIQKELQASQTNIPYKEIRQINTVGSSSFKDGMFIRKKPEVMERQAQEIIAESDSDGDGKINVEDFIDLMHENQKRGLEFFEQLDTDSDGVLTIHDIISHPHLAEYKLSKEQGTG